MPAKHVEDNLWPPNTYLEQESEEENDFGRFLIDDIPIRIFANKEKIGVPYPTAQAMGIHGSLWNADD